jgi:small-conductance mechanosensitive channel
MKTPVQEVIAQVIFWSSIGCLPVSIWLAISAIQLKRKLISLGLIVLSCLTATQFLWYLLYLGEALANKVGTTQQTPWIEILPFGVAIAGITASITYVARVKAQKRKFSETIPEERKAAQQAG